MLNDIVFSCKANNEEEKIDTENQNENENDSKNESKNDSNNENKYISTGGLRAVVMRGGPLDLGFHHTDSNRLKMTIEMYVSFSEKGIKASGGLKDDNLFLMIRTLGGTESSSSSPIKKSLEGSSSLLESLTSTGIMWSLSVDKNGCLIFNIGHNLKSTSNTTTNTMKNIIKSGPKCVSFEDVITIDDEDEDRVTPTWSHVVAVIDSSSNYENDNADKWPTTSSVTLYVNCEKVAQGDVTVPLMKEEDLAVPGVLYVCPCLPGGSRMTELRMVRTAYIRTLRFIVVMIY